MKPGLCQREFKVRFYFGADPYTVLMGLSHGG